MPPKSNLFGPSEVFLQKGDGSFVPLGKTDQAICASPLAEGETAKWWTSATEPMEFSVTCDATSRAGLQRMMDETALESIVSVIRAFRRHGYRSRYYFELPAPEYRMLRAASRRLWSMNPTRYIRSVVPSAPAKLFRVRLPSGSWVWRK